MKFRLCFIASVTLLLLPTHTFAQLMANFETSHLNYYSSAGDCDFAIGTPTCELYFKMGIFTSSGQQGDLKHYPGGCSTYSHDDGFWPYPDQVISRQLPDMAGSATIYFALFDRDPLGTNDDLLGTYSTVITSPTEDTEKTNNDALPQNHTATSCDDDSLDDDRASGRFKTYYSVWFTDESAPSTPGTPVHDDDAPSGWDNDTRLDFAWAAASDPHTGITYDLELYKGGIHVRSITVGGSLNHVSVCSSGCTLNHAVTDGNTYSLRVNALNGASIDLSNPSWSGWSEQSSPVTVDLDSPVTSMTGPAEDNWQRQDFSVDFSDNDDNLAVCEYRINSGNWQVRECNSPVVVQVGTDPGDVCVNEGASRANVCVVYGRSNDDSGNMSAVDSASFSIDFREDLIETLLAYTDLGGVLIPEGVNQQDTTPYMKWQPGPAVSPIVGFSASLSGLPDCEVDTVNMSANLGPLPDGVTTFRVRTIDEAGNCGIPASFDIVVNLSEIIFEDGFEDPQE